MLPIDPTSNLLQSKSAYSWNERAGRYIDRATGRFVAFSAVERIMEGDVRAASANMRVISEQLRNGEISLASWQSGMMTDIRRIHLAEAMAARGGWRQMTQSDYGWVGQRIRTQYDYLNKFAGEIANGTQPLDGRFLLRVDLYASAGRTTFQEMRRRYEASKGKTMERRVLAPAEHCTTQGALMGCVELAALGWQPIGFMPPIGETPCIVNCKCHYEFR